MDDVLYKYTDQSGAKKILGGRTLKCSHYTELNDPFDAYFHDMLGLNWDEVKQKRDDELDVLLSSNPAAFAKLTGCTEAEAIAASEIHNKLSPEEKIQFRQLCATIGASDPELQRIDTKQILLTELAKWTFETTGIFCATGTKDNLLMWAHYADKHRGVVIGLKPDKGKDSVLTQMRPVTYTTRRPDFFKPHDSEASSYQFAENALYEVLYSKSPEWAYEQELRLAIPQTIMPGKTMYLMNLHPTEVVELYLGIRMDSESAAGKEIIELARSLNSEIKIYQTRMAKRSYELEFVPIT